MLFAIEPVCESILGVSWDPVGGTLVFQLGLRSDFESICYKICLYEEVGVRCPPTHSLRRTFFETKIIASVTLTPLGGIMYSGSKNLRAFL